MKKFVIIFLILNSVFLSHSQIKLLDTLNEYISEYKSKAIDDSSKMWGISFDIPIIIACDSFFVTNKPVLDFLPYKEIFYGKTNDLQTGGNGEISWQGNHWAFFTYSEDFFSTKEKRLELFFHEAFHRNQLYLNLDGQWTNCKHLNNSDARILLKLEYNALLKALKDSDFVQSLTDALTFRAYRYYLYPNAYIEEQKIEISEGTANYNGYKMSGYSDEKILENLGKMTFNPQTFSYYSGAAYCFILDKSEKEWRKIIDNNDNFLYFSQNIFEIKLPDNLKNHIDKVKNNYSYSEIIKEEKIITAENRNNEKNYKKIFLKSPVLKIEFENCKGFSFQSTIIYPFEDGKIYNNVKTSGDWGKLESENVVFISDAVYLSCPLEIKEKNIIGDGWKIDLNDGWGITKTNKKIYKISKK